MPKPKEIVYCQKYCAGVTTKPSMISELEKEGIDKVEIHEHGRTATHEYAKVTIYVPLKEKGAD